MEGGGSAGDDREYSRRIKYAFNGQSLHLRIVTVRAEDRNQVQLIGWVAQFGLFGFKFHSLRIQLP